MFRLITAISLVLMPIISVATGGSAGDPFPSRDVADNESCTIGNCGGSPPPPFTEIEVSE